MLVEARDEARGHWPTVLLALGFSDRTVSGRHGPCPICGGKDRFRFDDIDGRGTWICNRCGAGDGFSLLMKTRGWSFGAAAREMRAVLGKVTTYHRTNRRAKIPDKEKLRSLYMASSPVAHGDVVDRYLRSRGLVLPSFPNDLRSSSRCFYDFCSSYPAMLAVVRDVCGQATSLHRTFLDADAKANVPNPRKLMPGKLSNGASVRLTPVAEEIGIAEGIETALACRLELGLPVWSALNASLLSKWIPPAGVRKVHVFADNDENFTGQEAADKLAKRLEGNGFDVVLHIPRAVGTDWADHYANKRLRKGDS